MSKIAPIIQTLLFADPWTKARKQESALARASKRELQFEKAQLLFEKQQKKVQELMARRRNKFQHDFTFFPEEEIEEVIGCSIDFESVASLAKSAEKAYSNSLYDISMEDRGKLIRSFKYVLKDRWIV